MEFLTYETDWLEIITIILVIAFFITLIVSATLSTEEGRTINKCKLECNDILNNTTPVLIDGECYCDLFYNESGEILNKTNNTNG